MPSIRDIATGKGGKKFNWTHWFKSIIKSSAPILTYAQTGYMVARHVGWFVVTVGIFTALPLFLEVKREALIERIEELQINTGISEGQTPLDLANSGLTSALGPKVLEP